MRKSHSRWVAFTVTVCMILTCLPWTASDVSADLLTDGLMLQSYGSDPDDTADVFYLYAKAQRDNENEIIGFDYNQGMIVDPDQAAPEIPDDYEIFGLFVSGGTFTINADYLTPGSELGIRDDRFCLITDDADITTDCDILEINMDNIRIFGGTISFDDAIVLNENSGADLNRDQIDPDDPYGYLLDFCNQNTPLTSYDYEVRGDVWIDGNLRGNYLNIISGASLELAPGSLLEFNKIASNGTLLLDNTSMTIVREIFLITDEGTLNAEDQAAMCFPGGSILEGVDGLPSTSLFVTDDNYYVVNSANDVYLSYIEPDGWTTNVFSIGCNGPRSDNEDDNSIFLLEDYRIAENFPVVFTPDEAITIKAYPPMEYRGCDLDPEVLVVSSNGTDTEEYLLNVTKGTDEIGSYYEFSFIPQDGMQTNIRIFWSEYDSFGINYDEQFEIRYETWGCGDYGINSVSSDAQIVFSPNGRSCRIAVDKDKVSTDTPFELEITMEPAQGYWLSRFILDNGSWDEYWETDPWNNPINGNKVEDLMGFVINEDGTYTYTLRLAFPPENGYVQLVADYWSMSSGIGIDDTRGYTVQYSTDNGENWYNAEWNDGRLEMDRDLFNGNDALIRFVWEDPDNEPPTVKGAYVEYVINSDLCEYTIRATEDNVYSIPAAEMPCKFRLAVDNEDILFENECYIIYHWFDGQHDAAVTGYDSMKIDEGDFNKTVYGFTGGNALQISLNAVFENGLAEVSTQRGDIFRTLEPQISGNKTVFTYTPADPEPFRIDIYPDEAAKAMDNFNVGPEEAAIEFSIYDYNYDDPNDQGGTITFDATDYMTYGDRTKIRVPIDIGSFEFKIKADVGFEIYDNYGCLVTEGEDLTYDEMSDEWTYTIDIEDQWNNGFDIKFMKAPSLENCGDRNINCAFYKDDVKIGEATVDPHSSFEFPEDFDYMILSLEDYDFGNIKGLKYHYYGRDNNNLSRFDADGQLKIENCNCSIEVWEEYEKAFNNEFEFLRPETDGAELKIVDGNGTEFFADTVYHVDSDVVAGNKFKLIGDSDYIANLFIVVERNNYFDEVLTPDADGYFTIPAECFAKNSEDFYDGFTVNIYDDQGIYNWYRVWPQAGERNIEFYVDTYRADGNVDFDIDGDIIRQVVYKFNDRRVIYDENADSFDVYIKTDHDFNIRGYFNNELDVYDEDLTNEAIYDEANGRYVLTLPLDTGCSSVSIRFFDREIRNNTDEHRFKVEYRFDDGDWTELEQTDSAVIDRTKSLMDIRVTSLDPNDRVNGLRLNADGDEWFVELDADGIFTTELNKITCAQLEINAEYINAFPGQFMFELMDDDPSISLDGGKQFNKAYMIPEELTFTVTGENVKGIAVQPNSGWTYALGDSEGTYTISQLDLGGNLSKGFTIKIYTDTNRFEWETVHPGEGQGECEMPIDFRSVTNGLSSGGEIELADGQDIRVVCDEYGFRYRFIYTWLTDGAGDIRFKFNMKPGWESQLINNGTLVTPDDDGFYTVAIDDINLGIVYAVFHNSNTYLYVISTTKDLAYWYGDDSSAQVTADSNNIPLPADADSITVKVLNNGDESGIRAFEVFPDEGDPYITELTDDTVKFTRSGDTWTPFRINAISKSDVLNGEIRFVDYTYYGMGSRIIDPTFDFDWDTMFTATNVGSDSISFKIDNANAGDFVICLEYNDGSYELVKCDDQGMVSFDFMNDRAYKVVFYNEKEDALYANMRPEWNEAVLDLYVPRYDYENRLDLDIDARDENSLVVTSSDNLKAIVTPDESGNFTFRVQPKAGYYIVIWSDGNDITLDCATSIDPQTGETWYYLTVHFNDQYSQDIFPKIIAYSRSDVNALQTPTISDMTYTGLQLAPGFSLVDDKYTLIKDTDYTVTYGTNISAGQGTITVEGIGKYIGTKTINFNIVPKSLTAAVIDGTPYAVTYDGSPIEPDVTVKIDGKTLVRGTDYTVAFENNNAPGTGKITVTGKGNYTDSKIVTFTINEPQVSPTVTVTPTPSPEPTVTATPVPTVSATPTVTPTATPVPTVTATPKPTVTATPVPTVTATPAPTSTATPVPTVTATPEPTVTVTPTAEPTVTATPEPTISATPTPTVPTKDDKADIRAFVDRIYTYVLNREPEEAGANYWTDELYNFNRSGAEVAQGFIFSEEFIGRNTNDREFVTILYKTFFGRDPDEAGMNYWLDQLASGAMDRTTVANGFIFSPEWADTCATYGIRSGGDTEPSVKIEPTAATFAFVERMYTTAMQREYDESGRNYWANELANFRVTGELVGASFFLSDEMTGYNLSDAEFLNRLYLTFMDRESDPDGAAYWLGVMASGKSRADVVFGFTRSPEFTEKCVEARILPF